MRHFVFALFALLFVTDSLAAAQEILPVRGDEVVPGVTDAVYVDVLPELIYRVPLEYPQIAREAGVDGTVMVQLLVDTNGVVVNALVKKSIPMLDGAALKCVRQWRFKPAFSNGRPVSTWIGAPVLFDLKAKPERHPGPPPPPRSAGRHDERPRLPEGEPLRPAEWPAGWARGEEGILFAEQIVLEQLPKVERRPKARFDGKPSPRETPRDVLVVAMVRVEPEGHVSAARIVKSVPPYDAFALRTVQLWKFRPAIQRGVPVAVSLYVPVMVRTR
ncbi:MAG: TonB family protein [Candidatus Eisenbacteria bacterium]|nr:TonB family protein [Candidatus Eisenbacteria bacterium]